MEREYNTSFEPIATPETLRHRLEHEEEKKQRFVCFYKRRNSLLS